MPTKEEIMDVMFSAIPDSYDKSEGSFMYDAVVSVATGLEDGYIQLQADEDKLFADTAIDEQLDRKVFDHGVIRKPAVKATTNLTITGTDGTIIPLGARFFVDSIYYAALESKTITGGTATVLVECEQEGSIGNVPANSIVNMEPILGVASVTNPQSVVNGIDRETDEDLRERFYEQVQKPATSGNEQHYINWCKEVTGVGDAKVFPTWNGNGTVKCVIINSNKRAADQLLIDAVTQNVEANRPINSGVLTIESAEELLINISVDVDISTGYDISTIQTEITAKLEEYFKEITFNMEYVSYALVGSKILEVSGVSDYRNLTLNGGTTSVTLTSTQIPVVGTVNVT